MKYLIVGLGNPGSEYEGTRHNIGFSLLDALAKEAEATFELERHAHLTTIRVKGRQLILLKPTTYMNLSGKAVQYHLTHFKINTSHLLIVLDDIALPFGQIKLKPKGSDGGHNGLKHIQATLNTASYPRLRIGIGSNYPKGRQADFVLGKFTDQEMEEIPTIIEKGKKAIVDFSTIGIDRTMGELNRKAST